MSVLYPHKIKVFRPARQEGLGGATGYGGQTRETDKLIAQDIEAAIQFKGEVLKPQAGLPGDVARRTMWKVLIPRGVLEPHVVQIRDVIEDDLKRRFQVTAPYLNAMGYSLLVELLDL